MSAMNLRWIVWAAACISLGWLFGCGSETDTEAEPTTTADGGTSAGGASAGGSSAGGSDIGGSSVGGSGSGYAEAVCDPLADLSGVAAAYSPSELRVALSGIATARYPIANDFLDAQTDQQLSTWFGGSASTFDDALDGFEVAVHEGSHIWGFENGTYSEHAYRIRDDLEIVTPELANFPRSEILGIHADPSADMYSDTYLTGQSGSQGFNSLLDEYNAYVHSLASKYCTRDALSQGMSTSARDGILTFMYYVELYLKLARTVHTDDYAEILADTDHVNLILTVWDRAEFWLAVTNGTPSLGIDDDEISAWTYAPDNVAEIEALRP